MDSQVISSMVQEARGMIEARRRQWHLSKPNPTTSHLR